MKVINIARVSQKSVIQQIVITHKMHSVSVLKPEIHSPLFTRIHKFSPISQIGLGQFDE